MDKVVHEYVVGENQQFNYTVVFDQTTTEKNIHIRFYLERNAQLVVEILCAHADLSITIECILRGEGAHVRIAGVYVLGDMHTAQINTIQHHQAAHTHSTLVIRGVVRDSAYAHYHGTIRVDKHARGSYASQENKNMLLSSQARAISVPSLEVLNNDVHCFHGSAVGRCDSEQLLYAASRGLDEKTAQRLLLVAFVGNVFVNKELNEQVQVLIG